MGTAPPNTPMSPAACPRPATGPASLRLLTRAEYDNTILDLLGDDSRPALKFPAENSLDGYVNDGNVHRVSPLLVAQYREAADGIAARVRDKLTLPCPAGARDAACGDAFVRQLAARAYRRRPTAEELQPLQRLFTQGVTEEGFPGAVERVVSAILQAPQFLYRTEAPSTDGWADGEQMASRLSYFLWGSMPDDELRAAAEAGNLATTAGVTTQVTRMLADRRARRALAEFHRQWLHLDDLGAAEKDQAAFPAFKPEMLGDWRQSLDAFLDDAVWGGEGAGLRRFFESPRVFLTDRLAPLYGARAGSRMLEARPTERAGLLTQPALMAMLALSNQSSPVARGVFVRERILCEHLPSPPPELMVTAPDPSPNATTRERFAIHTENPACGTCHALIDPLGFLFEGYDTLGRFRTEESGKPVNARGALNQPRDPGIAGPADGAVELARRLAGSPQVRGCVATHYLTFAMGRPMREADACAVESMAQAFGATGDFRKLLAAIATSDMFRRAAGQEGGTR